MSLYRKVLSCSSTLLPNLLLVTSIYDSTEFFYKIKVAGLSKTSCLVKIFSYTYILEMCTKIVFEMRKPPKDQTAAGAKD